MHSNLLDTNAAITSPQPPLRLVPAIMPKLLIVEDYWAGGRNDCLVRSIDFDRHESFLVPFCHQSSSLARFRAARR